MDPINPVAGNPEALSHTAPLPPRSDKTVLRALTVLFLLLFAVCVYLVYQNMQLQKQITSMQTIPSPMPTPTGISDQTLSWRTYTNDTYHYSLKHPVSWEEIIDPKSENREFTLKLPNGERIHGTVFTGIPDTNENNNYKKTFELSKNTYILITYVACDGPACGFGKDDILSFTRLLTTFTLLDETDEVLGIQLNTCCSCPTKINKSLIGTDGWILYEKGKNYSSRVPDSCSRLQCAPCPPLE